VLSAAAVRAIPCVQHLRTVPMNGLSDPLGAIAARIAVSEYIRRLAGDQMNIHVIPDGVDTSYFVPDAFARAQARLALEIPASAFVILVAARIDPRKRHDLLLEAMQLLWPSAPEALLLIAGDDADYPEWARKIHRMITTMRPRQCVRRLGFQRDMKKLYAAADVLVACGDAEPLGCSVLESISMGLPVVISNDGGQTELIEPGRSGLAFPSGDAVQLADRLLLLRDSDLRTRLGTAARERIRKDFSIEVTAGATLRVIENTARSNQASSTTLCPDDTH
jgi:glycosyltransferase involved in cell wall biosynthesis